MHGTFVFTVGGTQYHKADHSYFIYWVMGSKYITLGDRVALRIIQLW